MIDSHQISSLLDRLASDDLDETTRRELLIYLEHHPDQWRDCALAFLEAQLWRHAAQNGIEVKEKQTDAPEEVVRVATLPVGLSNHVIVHRDQGKYRWLSSAALVLVAFGIGFVARNFATSNLSPEMNVAQGGKQRTASVSLGVDSQHLMDKANPVANATNSLPNEEPNPSESSSVDREEATDPELRNQSKILLAIAPNETRIEDLSREVVLYWRRKGYVLQTEQRFLQTDAKDGTKVTVPIKHIVARPTKMTIQ